MLLEPEPDPERERERERENRGVEGVNLYTIALAKERKKIGA